MISNRIIVLFISFLLLTTIGNSQTLSEDSVSTLKKIIRTSKNVNSIDNAYLDLLVYYDYESKDSAISIGKNYIEFVDQLGIKEKEVLARRMLSSFYEDIGFYNLALDVALEGLKIAENLDNQKYRVLIFQGLGWIYDDLKETDQMFDYFNRSLELSTKIKDTILIAYSYYCIGSAHLYRQDTIPAIKSLEIAYQLVKNKNIGKDSVGILQAELGMAYARTGDTKNAQKTLDELIVNKPFFGKYINGYLSGIEYLIQAQNGEYQLALDGFRELMKLIDSQGIGYSEEAIHVMEYIIYYSKKAGIDSLTVSSFEELRRRELKWIELNKIKQSQEMQVKFETVQKDLQITLQQADIKRKNFFTWILIISSILLFGTLSTLYISNRRIKKKNTQIETLMRELHHRVKNNLQVISSLLGLQSSKLEDETAQKAVEEGQERIRAMSLIHQKLYQQDDVTSVNLKEYLETLVNEISESYGYSGKTELRINIPEMPMDVDTTMPIGLIVNELVSNSFKYAFEDIEKPILKLELIERSKGKYEFSVSDNGRGLPQGFSFEKATSFGLKLVRLLVRQLGARMDIKQKNGLEYHMYFTVH